jgi:regulatory protein
MRLLATREHSRYELYRKLQSRFADSALINPVLDGLEEQGYLNDERFLEDYLHMRMRKGYGPLRIKSELKERGLNSELISRHLKAHDSEWYQLMQQAAVAKIGEPVGSSYKTQQKLARFLEYRGFPESMIRHYLWDDEWSSGP